MRFVLTPTSVFVRPPRPFPPPRRSSDRANVREHVREGANNYNTRNGAWEEGRRKEGRKKETRKKCGGRNDRQKLEEAKTGRKREREDA